MPSLFFPSLFFGISMNLGLYQVSCWAPLYASSDLFISINLSFQGTQRQTVFLLQPSARPASAAILNPPLTETTTLSLHNDVTADHVYEHEKKQHKTINMLKTKNMLVLQLYQYIQQH